MNKIKMEILKEMIRIAIKSLEYTVHVDTGMSISSWTLLSKRVGKKISFTPNRKPYCNISPAEGRKQSKYILESRGGVTYLLWHTDVDQYAYWEDKWRTLPSAIDSVLSTMTDPCIPISKMMPSLIKRKKI